MNSKTALCMSLLKGDVINIRSCFLDIGLSNAPREISRMVEQPFGVVVSRTHMVGKSRYGVPVSYTNYRLNRSPHNLEGIEKIKNYIKEQFAKEPPPKTGIEQVKYRQQKLFINSI